MALLGQVLPPERGPSYVTNPHIQSLLRSPAPDFILSPGNGTKTVYFKSKNAEGESAAVSDTITLDHANAAGAAWVLFE